MINLDHISSRKMTLLRKLQRKKYRQKEKRFVVEGERAIEQIIANGSPEITNLYFDEERDLWLKEPWTEYTSQYDAQKIPAGDFREVTDTDHPQGILAVCCLPESETLEEFKNRSGMMVAFDRIRDPGNAGTMIRSAVWFGASGLIAGKGTVDLFHPKVVRSTAGATGQLPYVLGELTQVLDTLEVEGWEIALLDGSQEAENLRTWKPTAKTVLVIGNEAHGLDPETITDSRIRLRIPSMQKNPDIESLNASIALSIALYQGIR